MTDHQIINKTILSLHIGQFGMNLLTPLWNRYYTEANVTQENKLISSSNNDNETEKKDEFLLTSSLNNYFSSREEDNENTYSPNALIIDTDLASINEAKHNLSLFSKDSFHYINKHDKKYKIESIIEYVKKFTEKTDNSSNIEIQVFNSFLGIAGSKLISEIQTLFKEDLNLSNIVNYSIFPSPNLSTNSTEIYNTVLGVGNLITDKIIFFDNEAFLSKFSCEKLSDINKLIADVPFPSCCSSTSMLWNTSGFGSKSSLKASVEEAVDVVNHHMFSCISDLTQSVKNKAFNVVKFKSHINYRFNKDLETGFDEEIKESLKAFSTQHEDWLLSSSFEKLRIKSFDCVEVSSHSLIYYNLKNWCDKFKALYNKRIYITNYHNEGIAEEEDFSHAIDKLEDEKNILGDIFSIK